VGEERGGPHTLQPSSSSCTITLSSQKQHVTDAKRDASALRARSSHANHELGLTGLVLHAGAHGDIRLERHGHTAASGADTNALCNAGEWCCRMTRVHRWT
jgi:hypothetical protein